MRKTIHLLLVLLLLLFSTSSIACGTLTDWMDVYEKKKSGNSWRDTSSRLDSKVVEQDD